MTGASGKPAVPDEPLGESQGFYPRGVIGWHRTAFTVTTAEPKRTYQLDFDGVFENGAVWINGRPVGGHGYGCTPFRLDMTAAVRPGENELLLRGVCLHRDLGCRGIAARPEMRRARLLTLKDMGCNCIRAAHHMPSAAFMDLCDELGFFVYEECFDKWHSGAYNRCFPTDWQDDLDAMLLRDRNLPSVIIWGVGNEVENQAHDSMIGTLTMLTARVREMDPTRSVTYAMNPHFNRPSNIDPATVKDIQAFVDEVDEREISDMQDRLACIRRIAECVDLIACNYQEQWYPFIHAMMPDKLILGTEIYQYFVGDPERFQNYTELPPALIAQSEPWIIGGCIWSGYDYLGESMGWPSRGWTGAPLRTNGDRRASYYMLRSFWNPEPMMHLEIAEYTLEDELTKEHWGFPPCEAHWDFPMYCKQLLPYLIATNCERVTIELPGRSIAAPPRGRNGLITGYLPYLPGTLTVRGFIGGREVCAQTLVTPIPLTPWSSTPAAIRPPIRAMKFR